MQQSSAPVPARRFGWHQDAQVSGGFELFKTTGKYDGDLAPELPA